MTSTIQVTWGPRYNIFSCSTWFLFLEKETELCFITHKYAD